MLDGPDGVVRRVELDDGLREDEAAFGQFAFLDESSEEVHRLSVCARIPEGQRQTRLDAAGMGRDAHSAVYAIAQSGFSVAICAIGCKSAHSSRASVAFSPPDCEGTGEGTKGGGAVSAAACEALEGCSALYEGGASASEVGGARASRSGVASAEAILDSRWEGC